MSATRIAWTSIILLCVALCGCARQDEKVTTLRFWALGREGEVVTELVQDFERLHPNIRITVQQQPFTAAHEKLLTAYAGDSLPDIGQIGNTWLPEFAALHALAPLQARVDTSAIVKVDDYFPGIWDTNRIDDTLFGIPWYVDTRLIFYRKDLLAEAGITTFPRTWDEWLVAMRAVKKKAGPDKYAILLPLNEYEEILSLSLQEADPLLTDNNTRGNFQSPGFRRAFDFYTNIFREQLAPRMSDTQISNVWDEFAAGFYTFYITGPWNVGEFRRRLPAEFQNKWTTAPLPGPTGPGAGLAGGTSLVIFAKSEKQDAAWQFIEFLSAPEQQLRFMKLSGDLPARRSAWADPALTSDAETLAFRDQLERVKPPPKVPEWERIAVAMRLTVERVVRGNADTTATLNDLNKEVDVMLEKRRWMLQQKKAAP